MIRTLCLENSVFNLFRILFMTVFTSFVRYDQNLRFHPILTFKTSLRHFNEHLTGQIFLQSLISS
ncbi:hypothetical protein HanXRQr2_Chr14g0664051 [Helianthus annuus]|uniref:Uncharacterized protein n=1 Tax=Helianthus annuus TaxID=4232 RepID=A0A9K3EE68_HELAN|nr:hypothetical protein HanXRQr2_Chr14g0664051 [Helianthus annuus]KAJ0842056.1 hypothetical protein HanPSC8_Chr14g0637341 [Helianthus annuus]